MLGQDAFLPEAQGIVWDVRDVNNIVPLDYGSEINTHFDVAYLGELLGGCRDRDMVSQVCETGANFGADVAMQIVLQPHLTTLHRGRQGVRQCVLFITILTDGTVQNVVFIGRDDQLIDRQPHVLGQITGKNIAKVTNQCKCNGQ